jgi:crossover junction endodeoxyribonuclease RuvC
MKVLGIDCGLAITGWAILEKDSNLLNKCAKVIGYGVIRTKAGMKNEDRLSKLYDDLQELIEEHKPDSAAIEDLFYFKNQKTVIKVGQARGVTILAAAQENLEIFDYTPLQVKQAVCGYGRATKDQVQKMVKAILHLKKIPKPDDAADALAIGICHVNSIR